MPIMVMMVIQSYKLTLIVLLLGGLLCISGSAWASSGDDSSDQKKGQEYCKKRISYENDMIYSTDKNYTFGLLFGENCVANAKKPLNEKKYFLSQLNYSMLNPIAKNFNKTTISNSFYLGTLAYTPNDIVLGHGGRPYASLAFYTNSLLYANENSAIQQQISIGALGTSIAEQLQKEVHRFFGYSQPNGWSSQISDGGEPTFLYSLSADEKILDDDEQFNWDYDLSTQLGGAIGYYTHLRASTTFRFGRIKEVPFWADFNSIHNTAPVPFVLAQNKKNDTKSDMFIFLTGGVHLVAYNATLQGQFRDSDKEISSSDVKRAIGNATLGFYFPLPCKLSASISLNRRTKEIRDGLAHSWVGFNLYW